MGKILLATSLLTSYGYISEQFMAWYGGDDYEQYLYLNRLIGFGQYAVVTWTIVFCNVIAPQVLWLRSAAPQARASCCSCRSLVLIGMWLERYMIITTSLHRDFLPSSWGMFQPTVWDYADLFRLDRAVLGAVPAVHPLAADDLDLGDAGLAAGDARARGGTMKPRTPIYGLMAEFETAERDPAGDAPARGRPATATWTPTRPTRSRAWRPSWACRARACPSSS